MDEAQLAAVAGPGQPPDPGTVFTHVEDQAQLIVVALPHVEHEALSGYRAVHRGKLDRSSLERPPAERTDRVPERDGR